MAIVMVMEMLDLSRTVDGDGDVDGDARVVEKGGCGDVM